MKQITEVIQNADSALHLHQIVSKSKQPEHVVRAFIREQSAFGNIDVVPTRGRYGNRYEWVGPLAIKEEMLAIAKEVEAESVSEAQLEPTAKLELPDSLPIEPEITPTEPETETKEPEDMIENDVIVSNSQADAPALVAPQLNLKISYMITAAKGKLERRRKLEAAQSLAKRWANEGYKDVTIHLASEYEHARVTSEVQFKRAL